MRYQIDLRTLKKAVNAVLDHVIEDLNQPTIEIDDNKSLYWHVPVTELYKMSAKPIGNDVGKLSDDFDFVKLIQRGQAADISFNVVHVAPLLRYIGEKVKS